MNTDQNLTTAFGNIFQFFGDIVLMFASVAPLLAFGAFILILLYMRHKKSMARDGEKIDLNNELYALAICAIIGVAGYFFDAGRNTITDGENSNAVDVSKKFDANNF